MARLRTALYALLALPLALVSLLGTLTCLLLGAALTPTALGPWLLAETVRWALFLGSVQRGLAARLTGTHVQAPARRAAGPGVFGRRRALLADRAGWRAVGSALLVPFTALPLLAALVVGYVYGLLFTFHVLLKRWNYTTERTAGGGTRHVSLQVAGVQFDTWPRWLLVVAVGLLLLLCAHLLVRAALRPHLALLAALLGPSAAEERIRTLEQTRAHAVEDAAATLRHIERDLHDGTQARLVGLGMQLTLIRELLLADAGRAQVLDVVDTAREGATRAVGELRHLVRGIHPPVLDEGLRTALESLTTDTPALHVRLDTSLPTPPGPAVTAIAYFCAAELLTNVVKHAGAREVDLSARGDTGRLVLRVRDDGVGGARTGAGSGLRGLRDRVATVDGTLECDSPPGGPTVVTVELPLS